MKLELGFKPLALTLGLLALLYATIFLVKLISVRRRVLELKRQGLVRFPLLHTKKIFRSRLTELTTDSQCHHTTQFLAIYYSAIE